MLGAALGGAGLNFLGNLFNGAMNSVYEWENRNWLSQSDYEDYRANYEKDISDYFLNKQMAYNSEMFNKSIQHDKEMQQLQYELNKNLSSTAYQRSIADLEKAGINIASLAGVSASPASASVGSPSSNAALSLSGINHSGARTNARMMNNPYSDSSALGTSLFNAMVAKDSRAADIAKQELIDNARHAHKMEEIAESKNLRDAEARLSNAKARYQEMRNIDYVNSSRW